jgi:hypothetical protein
VSTSGLFFCVVIYNALYLVPSIVQPIYAIDTRDEIINAEVTANSAIKPSSSETHEFNYALYSGSKTQLLNPYGWKSSFKGDVYTGNKFNYGGSELYIDGSLNAVQSIVINGWKQRFRHKIHLLTW